MIYLEGDTCYLRTLNTKDAPALADLTYRNKMYWSVYEPLHRDDYYTTSVQREKIRESLMLSKEKESIASGFLNISQTK